MKLKFMIILLPLLFSACEGNRVFKNYQAVPDNVWQRDVEFTYDLPIVDPEEYQAYIAIRHGNRYPADNILLVVTAIPPDGEPQEFKYDMGFKTEEGKWRGEGMGDTWDVEMEILKDYEFIPGDHKIIIAQELGDMVPLIKAVGLKIYQKEE